MVSGTHEQLVERLLFRFMRFEAGVSDVGMLVVGGVADESGRDDLKSFARGDEDYWGR